MKKSVSLVLSMLLITLSCFMPIGYAAGADTEALLGPTFNRITLGDKAFSAGIAREISFTVPETGNYALFVNKEDTNPNAYSAVFTQSAAVAGTDADYSITLGGTDKDANGHKYNYTRVGAVPVQKSGSVYLYKGACTLSLTALNATSVKYVDLRGTDIPIGDGKTGISPADYYEYSSVTAANHVNGEISKGKTLSEGFTYHNMPSGSTTTRQFHLENGRTVTYNLNVTKTQNYRISVRSSGFVWSSNPGGTANMSFKAYLDSQEIYQSPVETIALTAQSNNGKDTWSDLGVYSLSEGMTALKIATTRGRYIYDIRIESTTEALTAYATTLPAEATTANMTVDDSVSFTDNYYVLNPDDSLRFAFEAKGDRPIDVILSGLYNVSGDTISYTCALDDNEPVSGTLTGYKKLLENQTVSQGIHTVTLTNTSDEAQLCPVTFTLADAELEDTAIDNYQVVPVAKDALITPVPLENTKTSYGKVDFLNNRLHVLNGGELTFCVDIEKEGYYTFYDNAKAAQTTTIVSVDGKDVTNIMYNNTSYADNDRVASAYYLDRKLTNGLVYLEAGEHTVSIRSTDICEINSISVRASDGFISQDMTEETVIPGWDFVSMQDINTGWYFPTQYNQKQSEGVQFYRRGVYDNMRNIIIHQNAKYTYMVYAEETGHYDFTAFFTSSNSTVEFLLSVDGLDNYYAIGTPNNAVGEATLAEPMYLTKGYHKITVSRTTRTYKDGVARVYAFSLRKSANNFAYVSETKTNVEAAFPEAVTGTVYVALYKGNRLVGTASENVSGAQNVIMTATNNEAPDRVRVFVWNNLKPLTEAIDITDMETKKINLFLMGDSVCVGYGEASFPQQGWGVYIGNHFDDRINVVNKAVGGTSTKTYQSAGYWEPVKNAIAEGDYVFINFGLNDFYNISETGKGTTITQYKENLTMFCNTILEKGATPVLISTIPECKENYNSLIARSVAMSEVANAVGVTFLDLNTTLNNEWLFDENGAYSAEKTLATFNYYYLSEPAFLRLEQEWGKTVTDAKWEYIQTTPDRTHPNEDGAEYIAATIAELLSETDHPLTKYMVD